MPKGNKRRSSPGPSSDQVSKSVAFGDGSTPVRSTGMDGTVEEEGMGEFEDNLEDGEESAEEIIRDDESDSDESETGESGCLPIVDFACVCSFVLFAFVG